MTMTAIRCEGLSKRYRLGERESYKTLRDVLSDVATAPFRRAASVFRTQRFQDSSNGSKRKLETGNSKLETSDSFWALVDVSFEVKRGEAVGIIGRNGAGKSTLLKILSRITKPTSGMAEIHGRVGSLLEVGTGFHPELTGRENILLNGAILGMRRAEIEKNFDEIVAFAEIEKFVDTPVKRYSSGMYVRLAFAVAAHLEPEILVIDEVLAVGDAAFQKKCLGKMGQVAEGGRTVLFVSHNIRAIRNLCSEVIWLDEGRIVAKGPSASVCDEYLKHVLHRSGSAIELADVSRPPGVGERLKIRAVEFNDGSSMLHGEPLNIRVHFETKSEIDGVGFGIGFCSLDGIRVMSVDSDLVEPQRTLLGDRVGMIEARIPQLHLQPGRYALDVGARSGNDNPLDYLMSCAQVEVLPGPNTPSLIIREGGGMRIPAEWKWANGSAPNQPANKL